MSPIQISIKPKSLRRAIAMGLLVVGGSSYALSARAGIFKDNKDNVYYTDTDATALGAEAILEYVGTPLTKKIRVGYCGEIKISPTSSVPTPGNSFTIDGTTYDAGSAPIDDSAKCSGNTLNPPPTGTIWKNSKGQIFITDAFIAGIRHEVTYNDVDRARTIRPNHCGFFRIANTSSNPLPATIKVAGTSQTIATLTAQNPPICKKGISGAYVRWDPQ